MRFIFFVLSAAWVLGVTSCISGSDRCGDGNLTWDPMANSCVDRSTDTTPPILDAGAEGDGGADSESAPPVLGEACTSDEDCAVYNANYCVIIQGEPDGFCTLQGCSADPDNCPSGYICCLSQGEDALYPDHCMPADMYDQFGAMICGN